MIDPIGDASQGVLVAPTRLPKLVSPISCSGCDYTWTGLGVCHCAAADCHRTFTGVTAFDLHKVGPPGGKRRCADPVTVLDKNGEPKLVPVVKSHWSGWGLPTDDEHSWWGAT